MFIAILLIVAASVTYIVVFFMTAWVIHQRGDHTGYYCWCDDARGLHYVPATIGALLWPIYWLYRLGRWLGSGQFNVDQLKNAWHRHRVSKLRKKNEIAEEKRRDELAEARHQVELTKLQQEWQDEVIGLGKATRIIDQAKS